MLYPGNRCPIPAALAWATLARGEQGELEDRPNGTLTALADLRPASRAWQRQAEVDRTLVTASHSLKLPYTGSPR